MKYLVFFTGVMLLLVLNGIFLDIASGIDIPNKDKYCGVLIIMWSLIYGIYTVVKKC